MTTTTLINGQSLGTGFNIGNNKFSIGPLTLAASTTAYVLSVKLVNGVGPVRRGQFVRVWYTSCYEAVTAANAPLQLGQTARYVDIMPAPDTAGVAYKDSSLEPVTGGFMNVWVDSPGADIASLLSVTLVELP
jgi:hypothetical protein